MKKNLPQKCQLSDKTFHDILKGIWDFSPNFEIFIYFTISRGTTTDFSAKRLFGRTDIGSRME